MDHLSPAWSRVSDHLVPWIVFTLVFVVVSTITCGLGLVFAPNVYLAAKKAVEEGQAPAIGDLFAMDHIVEYVILLVVGFVASLVGAAIPVIGSFLVAMFLFWAPMLIVDGKYSAIEAIQVSARAVAKDFVGVLLFLLVQLVGSVASGFLCGLPLLILLPWLVVAAWMFYQASEDALNAAAKEAGF